MHTLLLSTFTLAVISFSASGMGRPSLRITPFKLSGTARRTVRSKTPGSWARSLTAASLPTTSTSS